ncbi:MAG TPA: hypothetical protein VGK39_02460 [Cyclobacteriaceae bacterium]
MTRAWGFLMVMLLLQCSSQDQRTPLAIKYEEARTRFLADSVFITLVDQKIAEGDTTMTRLKNTLQLSYDELIQQPGFDSLQVENFISSLDISTDVLKKFNDIDQELQQKIRKIEAQYSPEELQEMLAQKQAALDSLAQGVLADSL